MMIMNKQEKWGEGGNSRGNSMYKSPVGSMPLLKTAVVGEQQRMA